MRTPLETAGLVLALLAGPLVGVAPGQAGDHAGEEQASLPEWLKLPPSPALEPAKQLATFRVPDGFRVELVAAEPLVRDPVVATFDADGRLWVAEMRSYMPDVDGRGEDEPDGAVVVLSDEDGDGRFEKRVEFLSGLVLPRAVMPCYGGALVITPPDLLFCRDTDGDGVADERRVLDTGLGGLASPEHATNGLLPTLDNAFHCANRDVRYAFREGEWVREATGGGGQWGATRDDLGRIFYNTNSDPLRGDLIPSTYAVRNPSHGRASGVNVRLAKDFSVWPSRTTPGINRGYQPKMLRDGRLAVVTAVCSPWIYRGAAFPEAFRGNAFVCEPAANLVMRFTLEEDERGGLAAHKAFETLDGPGVFDTVVTPDDPDPEATRALNRRREFLTSTDERFRPVALTDGPDGALYVVDMYRGVLQHRMFVTSFLRAQVVERELEQPIGLGRIWRVVHESAPRESPSSLAEASWGRVAALLDDDNGFWRDMAQRVIVEEGAESPVVRELLREKVRSGPAPLGRMHALWALRGIGWLTRDLALAALRDADPRVALAAVRASEFLLGKPDDELLEAVVALADRDLRLRWQVLLSLGEVPTEAATAELARLASQDLGTGELRSAVLSGLAQRELAFLERLLADEAWHEPAPGREVFLKLLARAVVREGRVDRIERLLELAAERTHGPDWQLEAFLQGALDGRGPGPDGKPAPIVLGHAPLAVTRFEQIVDPRLRELAGVLQEFLAWPGGPGRKIAEVRPLDEGERALFERGRELYGAVCASCHLSSGLGDPGKAPRLRGSQWVLGPEDRPARILLHGLTGPLEMDGETWNLDMPAYSASDEELAAVLTYLRREWGHGAEPVAPAGVRAVREAFVSRPRAWTVEELLEDER